MADYDIAIVGAGIVGLSVAYNLLQQKEDLRIVVLEKEKSVALHQTGRNSGVIHSGIYYKPGSSKAINCRRGYSKLIDFCEAHNVDYEICGKIVVATSKDEVPTLMKIYERGKENGLTGLKLLNEDQIKEKEPHVQGEKAIWVPQTGIVDYGQMANKLHDLIKSSSCEVLVNHKVKGISFQDSSHQIDCGGTIIRASYFVNCAGLYSDKIAKLQGVKFHAKIVPFKGEYYLLKESKRYLIRNLVYPVPNPAFPFLGVHFTRRINGKIDAGPNAVLAFKREGYKKFSINIEEFLETVFYKGFIKIAARYFKVGAYELYRSLSKKAFTKALQKLVPEITSDDLTAGEPGIRAQLCDDKGNLIEDFVIEYATKSVHVLNAPSPAATSSLEIGYTVSNKILKRLG
nr:L-2-hydroxyglutarate oxidase [uncultured Allomuricauda sp.]